MFKSIYKTILILIFSLFILSSLSKAEIINNINIEGNKRISKETIIMFADVSIRDQLSDQDLNIILKKLYDTNFFNLVSVKIIDDTLIIKVDENPIIQNINYEGIKSSKLLEELKSNVVLKSRSSFNDVLLSKDKSLLHNITF